MVFNEIFFFNSSWFYHEHRKSVKEKEMQILRKPEESHEKDENDAMLEKKSQVECKYRISSLLNHCCFFLFV